MNKTDEKQKAHIIYALFKNIPIAMRMTLLLLFVLSFQLQAELIYSQDTKISLDLRNSTVERVLQTIEEKSDYYFLYNNRLIDVDRKVSVRVRNAAISDVLEELFRSENVDYEVKESQIILSPKELYKQISAVANSAVRIEDGNWLFIPRDSIRDLDIYGEKAEVTVLTWFKKDSDKIWQAIAGVWDETHKKRQYYLFSNAHSRTFQDEMVRYPASNLIHGHISATGGVSPGERAWISYASSNDAVEVGVWTMIAMTYDGKNIKLYINGELSRNEKTNPFKYEEGIFDGGSDGADFTVGANHVQGKMTNQFIGAISGLSVFDKALSEKDIKWIYCNGIDLD